MLVLHDLVLQDVFDTVWHSIDDDRHCLLRGLWQGKWNGREDVKGGRLCMALAALQRGTHLAVEEEVDDGPVTEQAIGPLLQAKLVQLPVLALWVLDVWLLHPQI